MTLISPRIFIDTLQLWTPTLAAELKIEGKVSFGCPKLKSFCTGTFGNSSEDTKNVIFVNCAEFESANFYGIDFCPL